jgi:Spy/CpxP family protein refolding chaperone
MRKALLTVGCTLGMVAVVLGQTSGQGSSAAQPRPSDKIEQRHDTKASPRPPFKWWAIDRYKQELKLTAEQSTEIEKVFQASMDRLRADKEDLDREQTAFSQLMERAWVDDREFQRAVDRLEMARYYVSKERTLMLVRIHNILTPEQRKGLDAIRKRNDSNRDRSH